MLWRHSQDVFLICMCFLIQENPYWKVGDYCDEFHLLDLRYLDNCLKVTADQQLGRNQDAAFFYDTNPYRSSHNFFFEIIFLQIPDQFSTRSISPSPLLIIFFRPQRIANGYLIWPPIWAEWASLELITPWSTTTTPWSRSIWSRQQEETSKANNYNPTLKVHEVVLSRVKRFFYASSACVYPEFKQATTDIVALKESE